MRYINWRFIIIIIIIIIIIRKDKFILSWASFKDRLYKFTKSQSQ